MNITIGSSGKKVNNYLILAIVALLFGLGIYIGHNSVDSIQREGYEYVPTELMDSLVLESTSRLIRIDTLDSLLLLERLELDGTDFVSDEEFSRIVKNKADELYSKTPVGIDSLFINEYDSAVSARRLRYN